MGWYFGHETRASLIAELTASTDSGRKFDTIRSCVRGSILWAKHQVTEKDGSVHTFIACYILSKAQGWWGYKPMDESMGPCYYHCPLTYLDGLSAPIGYAAQWRERVRAYWQRRRDRRAMRA
jgi:hypothetical protein